MSPEKNNAVPEPVKPVNPLKDPALVRQEVPEVLTFLRESGTSLLIGVGLAVAVFLGYSAYRNYKKSTTLAAVNMLVNSRTAEQIQKVTSDYPSAPIAPMAHLALAAQHYEEGQYELAQYDYIQFEQKFPNHEMQPSVDLGKAQCLEAMGQYDDALAQYTQFETKWPDHFLAPMAAFGKARSYEQAGHYTDAKAAYEDFIAANPTNRWTAEAEAALRIVEKEMRAQKAD